MLCIGSLLTTSSPIGAAQVGAWTRVILLNADTTISLYVGCYAHSLLTSQRVDKGALALLAKMRAARRLARVWLLEAPLGFSSAHTTYCKVLYGKGPWVKGSLSLSSWRLLRGDSTSAGQEWLGLGVTASSLAPSLQSE